MGKIVPLISSGTAGPLGVLHLPRLWQKLSLGAAGKLSDEYPACGAGYDQMVLDGLGIEKEATMNFIRDEKPNYCVFEKWVQDNGSKVNAAAITELNAAIVGYEHTDETRKAILSGCELPDGDPRDAVALNNLDDWLGFYNEEIK